MKEEGEATCLAEPESPGGGMHSRAIYMAFIKMQQVNFSSQAAILKKGHSCLTFLICTITQNLEVTVHFVCGSD